MRTADWSLPNGHSVLSGAERIGRDRQLLMMADHLVDPALVAAVARSPDAPLTLGIDRRLDNPLVDMDDVTRVKTDTDGAIVAIGKLIDDYDCFDTGVFAVGQAFFDALAGLDSPSLTEGVRILAAQDRARVVDCSDLDWLDVDDAPAFAHAEGWMTRLAA